MSKLIAGAIGNKTELDLNSEVSISLTFSIADVKNLSSRSGAYSKTIALPGTAINNRFFGGLYDVNADFTQFNPNVRTDVVLTVANMEVLVGFLQLKTIDVNDEGFVTYNVLLFDSAVNFMTDLGGLLVVKNPKTSTEISNNAKSINDIKFNDEASAIPAIIKDTVLNLNHNYTYDSISDSWADSWNGKGYYYPLLSGTSETLTVEDFQPAIYHKTLLDGILTHHGYTWSGTLKDNADYERDIIPYTGVAPKESELDASVRTFRAGITPNFGLFGGVENLINHVPADPTAYFGVLNSDVSIDMSDETNINGGFFDDNNRWNGLDIYTAVNTGRYYFKHSLNLKTQIEYDKAFGNPSGAPLTYKMSYGIHAKVYNSSSVLQYTTNLNLLGSTETELTYPSGNTTNTESTSVNNGLSVFNVDVPSLSINEDYFELNAGDYVTFILSADSNGLTESDGSAYTGSVIDVNNIKVSLISLEAPEYIPTPPCYIECIKVVSPLSEWQLIDYVEFIPKKLKQSDIIHDLIARYNCIIYPDPDNVNNIVFDIGEDFYSTGLTADWSHKRDTDNRDKITLLGDARTSKTLLTYTPAKDANNVNYYEASGETFGQYEYDFNNDFSTTVKAVKSPFEPTELLLRAGGAIVPALNPNSATANFRILTASNNLVNFKQSDSFNYFTFNYRAIESSAVVTSLVMNNYPYAGCFNYPININGVTNSSWKPSVWQSINFGQLAFLNASLGNEQPSITLQTLYWSSALRQTSKGKLLEGMFNLNVADLDFVRLNPNARVYVSNKWWRVNKMTLEANDNLRRLTKVELVSVE